MAVNMEKNLQKKSMAELLYTWIIEAKLDLTDLQATKSQGLGT